MRILLLSFPHKLSLKGASKLSRFYFVLLHFILFCTTIIPFVGVFIASMVCPLIWGIEKGRHKPHSYDALRFAMQRIILFGIAGMVTGSVYFNLQDLAINPKPFWITQFILLGGLGFTDLLFVIKGQTGYGYIPSKSTSRTAKAERTSKKSMWKRFFNK